MQIDARNLDIQGLLRKIKDALASKKGCDISIDLKVSKDADTKKIRSFIAMSGCKVEITKEDTYYLFHIHGHPCCM